MKNPPSTTPAAARKILLVAGSAFALVLALAATLWPTDGDSPALVRPAHATAAEQPRGTLATAGGEERGDARPAPVVDAALAPYEAPAGTRLRFALRAECRNVVRASGQEQPLDFAFEGELVVDVLARRGTQSQVALSCPSPRVTVRSGAADGRAAEAQAIVARDLQAGVIALVDVQGTVLGLGYPETVQPDGRGWMRKVVTSLFPRIAGRSTPSWELERGAADITLELRARWMGDDETARVRTARYELGRVRRSYGVDPNLSVEVSSTGEVEHDAAIPWVVASRLDERVVVRSKAPEFEIEQGFTGSLQLLEQEPCPVVAWNEHGAWLPADGTAEGALDTRPEVAQDLPKDPRALLAEAIRLTSCDECPDSALEDLRQAIAALLREDPTALALFVQHLERAADDDPTMPLLLSAMALAGTEPTQTRLAQWIADGAKPMALRDATLIASFGVEHPGNGLIDSLRGLARDEQADTGLSGTALLALGDLARKSGARREELVKELVAWEADAERTGETSTWLYALGNAGAPEALEAVARHTHSTDERTRLAALTAASGVLTPASTPLLADAARNDASPEVRQRAAYLLASRPGVLQGAESVREVLAKETEPEVRLAAVSGLAHSNDVETALPILEHTAKNDASDVVRERAERYAQGWRTEG